MTRVVHHTEQGKKDAIAAAVVLGHNNLPSQHQTTTTTTRKKTRRSKALSLFASTIILWHILYFILYINDISIVNNHDTDNIIHEINMIDDHVDADVDTDTDKQHNIDINKQKSLYDPFKVHYLNTSDAKILKYYQPDPQTHQVGNFSIDILTIGSISSVPRAETQMKTWGSHISRRHFWLATEFDDVDPSCHTRLTFDDVAELSNTCKSKRYWESHGSNNKLTNHFGQSFARIQWLSKKKNPVGWMCAQQRFIIALSKLLALYREGREKYGIDLPDYLVFGDDDTYLNMEMIENQLLRTPRQLVHEKGLTLDDELQMLYPTQNTPVVFAGCRVRSPMYQVNNTIPFGGYGVLISKAAIERFIQPLYCNETTMTGFEAEACDHWTPEYSQYSISERQFFEPGMSVSDLMGSYVKNMKTFCLQSDWAIGYFVNHFNISRHVVPTIPFHPNLKTKSQAEALWYNDQMGDVKHARIHSWYDGSEIYKRSLGNCAYQGVDCNEKVGSCHYMNETLMHNVHDKVKQLFPKQYRESNSFV